MKQYRKKLSLIILSFLLIACSKKDLVHTNLDIGLVYRGFSQNYVSFINLKNGSTDDVTINSEVNKDNNIYIYEISLNDNVLLTPSNEALINVEISDNGLKQIDQFSYERKKCDKTSIVLDGFGEAYLGYYFWEIGSFDLEKEIQSDYLSYNNKCYSYENVFSKNLVTDTSGELFIIFSSSLDNSIQLTNFKDSIYYNINLDENSVDVEFHETIIYNDKIFSIISYNNSTERVTEILKIDLDDGQFELEKINRNQSLPNINNTRLYIHNDVLFIYDNSALRMYNDSADTFKEIIVESNENMKLSNFHDNKFYYLIEDIVNIYDLDNLTEIESFEMSGDLKRIIDKGGFFKFIEFKK